MKKKKIRLVIHYVVQLIMSGTDNEYLIFIFYFLDPSLWYKLNLFTGFDLFDLFIDLSGWPGYYIFINQFIYVSGFNMHCLDMWKNRSLIVQIKPQKTTKLVFFFFNLVC